MAGLAVRGLCPKCGRVVNTNAPPKRTTWRGECPTEGCKGTVIARRVMDKSEFTQEPKSEPTTKRRQVVKVNYERGTERVPEPAPDPSPEVRSAPDPAPRPTVHRDQPERRDKSEAVAADKPIPRSVPRAAEPEGRRSVTPYDFY